MNQLLLLCTVEGGMTYKKVLDTFWCHVPNINAFYSNIAEFKNVYNLILLHKFFIICICQCYALKLCVVFLCLPPTTLYYMFIGNMTKILAENTSLDTIVEVLLNLAMHVYNF